MCATCSKAASSGVATGCGSTCSLSKRRLLSAEIVRVEARRAEAAANPDALDFWFRGTDWINRGISPDALANARDCFDRALAIDPANVNATLGKVMVAAIETRMRGLAGPREKLAEAEALVTRALAKEPNNAHGRYCLALVLMFSRRTEQAIAELERALALDPNMAFAHAQIGFAKCLLAARRRRKRMSRRRCD